MAAAGGGHLSCTQQLLDWGAKASYSAPDGITALMAAASGGHIQCVAALINAGAGVNDHDHRGMSAIMLAAAAGHVTVLRCLIRHKAALDRMSFQVCMAHGGRSPHPELQISSIAGESSTYLSRGDKQVIYDWVLAE